MKVKVSKTEYIERDLKVTNEQGVAFRLELFSIPSEQKDQIEEATNIFLNSVTEILESNPSPIH